MPSPYTPISQLNSNSSFYDWFTKENSEIIAKLNLISAYTVEGTNGITAPTDANGKVTVSLSGKVDQGISFNGPAYFNGFASIPNIAIRVDGITLGTSSYGYTFGMPVRVYYDTATSSIQYEPARSIDPDSAEVLGVISSVNETHAYVTLIGKIDGNFTGVNDRGIGLTAGWIYFLSGTTGHITDVEPTATGYVSKPVLMGISGSSGLVLQMRGNFLNPNIVSAGISASNKIIFAGDVDMRPEIDVGNFISIYNVLGSDFFGAFKDYFYNSGLTYSKILNTDFSVGLYNSYLVPSVPTVSLGITGPNNRFVKNDSDHVIGMITNITSDGIYYYYEVLTSGYTTVLPRFISQVPSGQEDSPVYLNYEYNPKYNFTLSNAQSTPTAPENFQFRRSITVDSAGVIVNSGHLAGIMYGSNFLVVNKHDSSGSALYSTYFPQGSPQLLSSTVASAGSQGNLLVNGNFQVWQRSNIGKNSYYTNTGNVKFADLWRRHDGITGGDGTKSYHIIRQSFDEYQNEIEGNPEYYLNVKAIGLSGIGMTGATLYSQTDHLMIGHVLPGAKRLDKNTVNVKFYGKSSYSGYDVDVYISRYTGATLINYLKLGSATLSTTWTPYSLSGYLEPL